MPGNASLDETFNRIKNTEYGSILFLGIMIMENMSLGQQEQDKEELSGYKNLYGEIDFKLLLNEHTYIEKEKIKLH
jgi:hypothetical protein